VGVRCVSAVPASAAALGAPPDGVAHRRSHAPVRVDAGDPTLIVPTLTWTERAGREAHAQPGDRLEGAAEGPAAQQGTLP